MHDKKMSYRTRSKITLQPKFLVMSEAYLSASFGPNISDFFDLCLHWLSIVRDIIIFLGVTRLLFIFKLAPLVHF